ncbi:MAG: hypothetical protein Q9186_006154 [Xanthomendoza sp. 1 TL-2023]
MDPFMGSTFGAEESFDIFDRWSIDDAINNLDWTGFEAPAAPAIEPFNGMAQQYGIMDNPMDTTDADDSIEVGAQLFKSAAKVSSNKLTGSQWRVIQALGRPAINTPNGMARRVRFADNVVDTTTAAIDTTTAPAINVPAAAAPQQLEMTATTAPNAARPRKRQRRRHTDEVDRGRRGKGAPKLTEEQKRLNHNASEIARRENIQAPIDALCQIVPALSMDASKSHAKVWVATRECAEWVKGERRRLTLALEARGINAREFLENREGVSH